MGTTGVLQVTGVKETAAFKVKALKEAGFVNTAETIRCLHCSARYMLLIAPGSGDDAPINILDVGKAIRELTEKVSAEHATGHASDRVMVDREYPVDTSRQKLRPS